MTSLSTFVLVGTIISHDQFLATVEFQLNPPTNGKPALAVLPGEGIPCKVKIGKKIFVVKSHEQNIPTITCEKEKNANF